MANLSLKRLSVLTDEDRLQLLEGWNPPGSVAAATLPDLFLAQAMATPDRVAVTSSGGTLSYAELREQSGGLASTLTALGVVPDDIVAIAVPRSVEMIVAVLAVVRAAAAYLPLDASQPLSRL